MDLKTLEQRLLKVAKLLEASNATISAEKIRKLADQLGKLVPEFPTEETEKERVVLELKRRILGIKINAEIQYSTDIIYYTIEFRTGAKVVVSQQFGGATRTLSQGTVKKPFMVSLVRKDETTGKEKTIPSGVYKSWDELIPFLQKISIGSQEEVTQLSKEQIYRSASATLDEVANSLEAKGLVKEAYKLV